MNSEFKVKRTPKDDKVVYGQNLSMAINLKDDLIAELALMHEYGVITVRHFSKYASPTFAHRKPNAKLRLFCKLDCSHAFLCLQMADQRSVEMLAFNSSSRTFSYRRLAQGISTPVCAFSSFMQGYLDSVVKTDQCAQ